MKRRSPGRLGPLVGILLVSLAAGACVTTGPYHDGPVLVEDPALGTTVSVVEFDDQGEPWDERQLDATLAKLRDAAARREDLRVITFVHGWNHNSEERDPNFKWFKEVLARVTVKQPKRAGTFGIYLSWRGRSSRILDFLTFWSRKSAAERVGGLRVTEALLRIMSAVRMNPTSESIIVGHSFGGLVVEKALGQAFLGILLQPHESLEGPYIITPLPADLVVMINPASSALGTRQMIMALRSSDVSLVDSTGAPAPGSAPILVSMTSVADSATGTWFPVGQGPIAWTKLFRAGLGPEPGWIGPSQKELFLRTAGHTPYLFTHVVEPAPLRPAEAGGPRDQVALGPEDIPFLVHTNGIESVYRIREIPERWNRTPYWVVSLPKAVVAGHGDIFNENVESLFSSILLATFPADRGRLSLRHRIAPSPLPAAP